MRAYSAKDHRLSRYIHDWHDRALNDPFRNHNPKPTCQVVRGSESCVVHVLQYKQRQDCRNAPRACQSYYQFFQSCSCLQNLPRYKTNKPYQPESDQAIAQRGCNSHRARCTQSGKDDCQRGIHQSQATWQSCQATEYQDQSISYEKYPERNGIAKRDKTGSQGCNIKRNAAKRHTEKKYRWNALQLREPFVKM